MKNSQGPRFRLLSEYYKAKFSVAGGFITASEDYANVYCNQCGNFANAVIQIGDYNVPICKPHFEKMFKWRPPKYGFKTTVEMILKQRAAEPAWQLP